MYVSDGRHREEHSIAAALAEDGRVRLDAGKQSMRNAPFDVDAVKPRAGSVRVARQVRQGSLVGARPDGLRGRCAS